MDHKKKIALTFIATSFLLVGCFGTNRKPETIQTGGDVKPKDYPPPFFDPIPSVTPSPTPTPSVSPSSSPSVSPTPSPSPSPSPTSVAYFVALNGSDGNNGSLTAPWRTIQKAMNSATPGSIVNIRAGTYSERLFLNVSGTENKTITFQPYGFNGTNCGGYSGKVCAGEAVVLDYTALGTVSDGMPFLGINSRSYVRIQGLTFRNYTTTGDRQMGLIIIGTSHHLEFIQNKFLNNKNTGAHSGEKSLFNFYVGGPSNNIVIRENEFGSIVSNMADNLILQDVRNALLEGNYFHDTDKSAVLVTGQTSAITLRKNLFEYAGRRRDGTGYYTDPAHTVYFDGGDSILIEQNTLRFSRWGVGITSETGFVATDVVIRNNVLYNNDQGGVRIGNWYTTDISRVSNCRVYNNTFYNSRYGGVLSPATNISWQNNIFAEHDLGVYNVQSSVTGHIFNYNLFFNNTGNQWYSVVHQNDVNSNPQFKGPTTNPPNFSLNANSPAINRGNPGDMPTVNDKDHAGNPRLIGGRIDIGSYEYQ